jgi:hypothetical protein
VVVLLETLGITKKLQEVNKIAAEAMGITQDLRGTSSAEEAAEAGEEGDLEADRIDN